MYSDEDIDSAVSAGIIKPEVADAFRVYVASTRSAPTVDEEHFRLVTGFNDIFVTIASILLLCAVGWLGDGALSGLLIALVAWGLAEYFTRIRRMALPSIVLLGSFVGGVFFSLSIWIGAISGFSLKGKWTEPAQLLGFAGAAALTTAFTWIHWRRFQVPITVAAGAAALAVLAVTLPLSMAPQKVLPWANYIVMFAGLCTFALAMRWDMSDPMRKTKRSDVAFWLHLLAAPMIIHPAFATLGLLNIDAHLERAFIVLALYLLLGIIALIIDRRALLVSALAYVLYAMSAVFKQFGAVSLGIAFTGLIIGSALLLLSAFWPRIRAKLVQQLPPQLSPLLPPIQR